MAFQFKLASLLNIREGLKKQEERALQRVLFEIEEANRAMAHAEEAITRVRSEWQQKLQTPNVAVHLQSALEAEQSLRSAKRSLGVKLEGLEAARAKQMEQYQAAYRNYESILDVKNKQLADHAHEQAKVEQKILDDVFVARRLSASRRCISENGRDSKSEGLSEQ